MDNKTAFDKILNVLSNSNISSEVDKPTLANSIIDCLVEVNVTPTPVAPTDQPTVVAGTTMATPTTKMSLGFTLPGEYYKRGNE